MFIPGAPAGAVVEDVMVTECVYSIKSVRLKTGGKRAFSKEN